MGEELTKVLLVSRSFSIFKGYFIINENRVRIQEERGEGGGEGGGGTPLDTDSKMFADLGWRSLELSRAKARLTKLYKILPWHNSNYTLAAKTTFGLQRAELGTRNITAGPFPHETVYLLLLTD